MGDLQPHMQDAPWALEGNETPPADTRLNVRLSPEARKALDWISSVLGISAVEAVRRAIGTQKFFVELANQKAKVFVQMPGEKNLKEVIFTPDLSKSA